jgi:hypothetical protein
LVFAGGSGGQTLRKRRFGDYGVAQDCQAMSNVIWKRPLVADFVAKVGW